MKLLKKIKDLKDKIVFLRSDLNVSVDKKTKDILSDFRIRRSIPTIKYLAQKKTKIILASHFGRPEGRVDMNFSIKFIVPRLQKLSGLSVIFAGDCVGTKVEQLIAQMLPGQILLLENLRFHEQEKQNNKQFARQLAHEADIFVNDAFGVCHRSHASVQAITKYLDSYAGLLLTDEIKNLDKIKKSPANPFVLIIGGSKISDKITALEKLGKNADQILLGGALANTFLAAKGISMGVSFYKEEEKKLAVKLMKKFEGKIFIPIDGVLAKKDGSEFILSTIRNSNLQDIGSEEMILDIGSQTIKKYTDFINKAQTIFWAGPLGMFEWPQFAQGTQSVSKVIGRTKAFSVVGGGDTVSALEIFGDIDSFSFVSTGGGAALEYLADKRLPGLLALE